ncbi:MAG TPA: anti-sigma-D factor RsdA [Pseudonocardiaceae bacterium]|nr:anti-sigma-D factor RsdA [Pseudonocardiaceae bacterium]
MRRYRRPRTIGSGREPLFPWTNDELADGVRHGIDDDFDDLADFELTGGPDDRVPPLEDDRDEPIDLAAMRADDALLDMFAGDDSLFMSVAERGQRGDEADLTSLLQSWRGEVDSTPIPALYSTDSATQVIAHAAYQRRASSRRWLVPVASAAAAVVIAVTGVSFLARDAQPGDTLWGVTQVLYADHAHSVEAAATVRTELNHASVELEQGHLGDARAALEQAQASMPSVDSSDGKADLLAQGQALAMKLLATTGVSTTDPTTSTTLGGTSTLLFPPPTSGTVPPSDAATTTTQQQPPPTTTTTTTDPPTTTTTSPPTTTDSSPQSAGPGTITTSDDGTGTQAGTQAGDSPADSSTG